MYVLLRNICCLCCVVLFLSACAKPPMTQQDVRMEPSLSAKFDVPAMDVSTAKIYAHVYNAHGVDTSLSQALQRSLQAKGYTVTENPRFATYIIHSSVAYMGVMPTDAVHKAVSEGYGMPVRTRTLVGADVPSEEAMSTVLVVDTLVAKRDLPVATGRVSEVVATVSRDTTTDHHTVRLAAALPVQGENTEAQTYLAGRMVEAIVAALPVR